MGMTRADLGKLIAPGLNKVFDDEYKMYSPEINEVFDIVTTERAFFEDLNTTGTSYLTEKTEDASITYENFLQGYATRYTSTTKAKGLAVSWEMMADDLYNVISSNFKKLSRSAVRSPDRDGMSVFRNAFSTSYISSANTSGAYGDAKPLCSVSHPRKDAGTAQSNASATGITLTEDNLETGRLALINQLDDKGMGIAVAQGKLILLVPPALEKEAVLITRSMLRQGTANNDMNFYEGRYNVAVSQYISATHGGSDTAWFLIDTSTALLKFVWRKKPEFDRTTDFETKADKFSVIARYTYGWSDWRGVWGSKGDATAYSN